MLWVENPALLANSPAMKGRQFTTNNTSVDSPALRFSFDGDDSQGISIWDGGDDEFSLDMLTDVDEVLDEDVSDLSYIVSCCLRGRYASDAPCS